MRVAEATNIAFFSFLILLAWMRPLAPGRRVQATAWGIGVISVVLGVQLLGRLLEPLPTAVIRDWLPAPLLLIAYWTAGRLFTSPNEKLQNRLARFDQEILGSLKQYRAGAGVARTIAACLEFAYMLCYALVPFGIGILYIAHMRRYADEFWMIVLSSVYLCYGALPFAQTLPPRMLPAGGEPILPPTKFRQMNLWILRHGSIQVNTFPSAHVATAFSVSLVLLHLLPEAGLAFLLVSISIAVGAVLGRYHYAADAIIGAAVAIVVFLIHVILC